jgi:hypothetical protein
MITDQIRSTVYLIDPTLSTAEVSLIEGQRQF